jgi:purine-binding chemotaxis protein CheW
MKNMTELPGQNESHTEIGSRHLSFSLGTEEYAIPLLVVKEVIAMPEITPIPYTPPHFLGIMNLRGQVISVMDLRQKLSIKPTNSAETAVIICDLNTICIGVVVDSINSVLSPAPSEISEKPEIQSNRNIDYITSIYRKDKRLILFLDIGKTLNLQEKTFISGNTQLKKAS